MGLFLNYCKHYFFDTELLFSFSIPQEINKIHVHLNTLFVYNTDMDHKKTSSGSFLTYFLLKIKSQDKFIRRSLVFLQRK